MGASGAAPSLMGALSVLGDEFDVQLAAEISGLAPADLLRAMDAAQRERLVVIENGLVRFAPGTREQAYRDLGSHGQATAHAHAADVLERVRPRDLQGIAEQRAGAVAVLGLGPALGALEGAADAAERSRDWGAAAELLRRAAEVAARERDVRAGPLAIRQAQCLFRSGLFAEALAVCRTVASEARAAGDGRLLADAALVVRGIADRDTCAVLLDFCRDALRRVGDDTVLRSRLQSQVIMLSSDLARVPTEGSEALQNVDVAEESGDVRALVESLHALHLVSAGPLAVARRLEIAERVERLCRDAGLDDDLAWPLGWRVDVLFQLGRRPALDNAIERLEEYADRHNNALANWRGKMARAQLAYHEGRFEDAVRIGGEALELANRGGHQAADFTYRILVSACRLKTSGGPLEPGFGFVQSGPDVFHVFPAMLAAEAGDLEKAAALFVLAVPVMHELDGSALQVQTHAALAAVAWALDRGDTAPSIHAALEPFADELGVSTAGQAASLGSVSRYLGQMAALMADWDRVEIDFARGDAAQPRDWRARGTCRNPLRLGDRSAASWTGA